MKKDDSARDKAIDKLVENRLRAGLHRGGGDCLDAELLAAYVERALAPGELRTCEAHLAGCLGCQALVAELVRLSEADEPVEFRSTLAAPSPAARSFRVRWAWAGSALAAMLVVGLWYTGEFRNVLEHSPGEMPAIQNRAANPSTAISTPPVEEKRIASAPLDQHVTEKALEPENKRRDEASPAGTNPRRIEAAQTTNAAPSRSSAAPAPISPALQTPRVRQAPAAPSNTPAPNDRMGPAPIGAMATPAERGRLAKVGTEESESVAQSSIGGIAGGARSTAGSSISPGENSKQKHAVPPPEPATRPAMRALETENTQADGAKSTRPESRASEKSDVATFAHPLVRSETPAKQNSAAGAAVGPSAESVGDQKQSVASEWRVGPRGLIQKSDSNGKWIKRKSGVKADLNGVSFPSASVGWVAGDSGTILRTTDGGTTWTKVPSPTNADLMHVTAISDQAASVVTRSGLTFTTTDGGKTWSGK